MFHPPTSANIRSTQSSTSSEEFRKVIPDGNRCRLFQHEIVAALFNVYAAVREEGRFNIFRKGLLSHRTQGQTKRRISGERERGMKMSDQAHVKRQPLKQCGQPDLYLITKRIYSDTTMCNLYNNTYNRME